MLDYEWENPSAIVLSGDERNHPDSSDSDPARALSIFDPSPYNDQQRHLISPPFFSSFSNNNNPHHHHHLSPFPHTTTTTNQLFHLYDPRTTTTPYPSDPIFHPHSSSPFFSFDPTTPNLSPSPSSYNFLVPKTEVDFPSNRIGLNLGGRTYFSAADDDFVTRLYRRSRPGEFGIGNSLSTPRCQAEGCNADLSHAKHYHRRHKVCEFHSKASTVVAAGLSQRFCQQCSRFHLLSEFDNGKRSCRKRLADHNRRRRKSHHSVSTTRDSESPNVQVVKSASPSNTPPPPTISLECFRQRQQFQTKALSSTSASSSSNSVFFSSG